MEQIGRMRADEKSKKVKVKIEMHPNLLNLLVSLRKPQRSLFSAAS